MNHPLFTFLDSLSPDTLSLEARESIHVVTIVGLIFTLVMVIAAWFLRKRHQPTFREVEIEALLVATVPHLQGMARHSFGEERQELVDLLVSIQLITGHEE